MFLRTRLALAVSVLALVACGGGGGDDSRPSVPTTAVKVVGDSLNDSGTFGLKFTVQNATTPYAIWTDHVTAAVAAPALCPRYTNVLAVKPAPSTCTSYGVGGATINPVGTVNDATPLSVVQQLKDVRAQGPYGPQELLLVDGGGNDLADLTSAYLEAAQGAPTNFQSLASELLTPGEITATGGTPEAVGAAYFVKLADLLANAITSEALDRDAQRIVVLTAPDITRTPKFLAVLAGVKLQVDGAGSDGTAAAAGIKTVVNQWATAFNNQLKSRFAAQSRVAVVDFYAELNRWLDTPVLFGLTNTTTPACPRTGTSGGLPTYSIATCTDTSLSAAPPVGESGANWWRSYVFSDDFHGTPRTNELMGQLVVRALEAKGWK